MMPALSSSSISFLCLCLASLSCCFNKLSCEAFSHVPSKPKRTLIKTNAKTNNSDSFTNPERPKSRRDIIRNVASATIFSSFATSLFNLPKPSIAAVTDETNAYASNASDSAYSAEKLNPISTTPPISKTAQTQSQTLASDEILISIPISSLTKGLGIELGDVEFRTNRRVFVKSIAPNSIASKLNIQKDWIVVSVNGQTAERTNAEGVAIMVSRAVKDARSQTDDKDAKLNIVFRDNSLFKEQIANLSEGEGRVATTQVAPAGDTTQRNSDGSVKSGYVQTEQVEQKLTVEQLVPARYCTRGATTDDLLEISYLGTVVETGDVFDGSAVKINGQAIPGRANDISIFFVLGKQPFGQFPPGWDVGLEGMCVGERRRLVIPPVLAYGSTGVPRRGIPPDATLQYDITLISLNGLATPQ